MIAISRFIQTKWNSFECVNFSKLILFDEIHLCLKDFLAQQFVTRMNPGQNINALYYSPRVGEGAGGKLIPMNFYSLG